MFDRVAKVRTALLYMHVAGTARRVSRIRFNTP